jgi:hypothetical protein
LHPTSLHQQQLGWIPDHITTYVTDSKLFIKRV